MALRAMMTAAALLFLSGSASAQNAGGDASMRLRQAESLERAGELDRALAILEIVLDESPAEPRAILAVERVNRRLRRSESTLEIARRAQAASPLAPVPREVELRVLAELGRFERLSEAGEEWLRLSPDSEQAYREYAGVLRRNGQTDAAEEILKRGRDALAKPIALSSELADIYLEQGRWAEAASEWVSIIHNSPGLGWDLVTFKLERLGPRAEPAASALLEALADSDDVNARMVAAIAAVYADRLDVATSEAHSVIGELSESRREVLVEQLARVGTRRSKPELVAWSYRLLLPYVIADSVRWDLARQIIQFDLSAADTTSALEILSEVLDRSEVRSRSHQWASAWEVRLLAAQTEPERAEEALERHVGLYPDDRELPALALGVAAANVREGRLEEADRALSGVPVRGRDARLEARMDAARGYLALYAGRFDDARERLETASTALLGAERSAALRFLGYLREGSEGELEALAAAHRAALQDRPLVAHEELIEGLHRAPVSPARPGLLLLAGEYAIEGGSVDAAEAILERIPQDYPDTGEAPVAMMTLADALGENPERAGDAVELLEALILDYPESALTPLARRRIAEIRQQVPRS